MQEEHGANCVSPVYFRLLNEQVQRLQTRHSQLSRGEREAYAKGKELLEKVGGLFPDFKNLPDDEQRLMDLRRQAGEWLSSAM